MKDRLGGYAILLSLFLLVGGCSLVDVGKLSQKELVQIRQSGKSIVLYRVTARVDGEKVDASRLSYSDWSGAPIYMRPLPIDGGLARVHPNLPNQFGREGERTLSEESRLEGWRYMVLNPGNYVLNINSRYPPEWRSSEGQNRYPSFFLSVPDRAPLLYAGSYNLRCSTNWKGSGKKACSGDLYPMFESDEVAPIVNDNFATLGPVQAVSIRRYGEPLQKSTLDKVGLLEIKNARQPGASTPNWQARATGKAFGWVGAGGKAFCTGGGHPGGCVAMVMIGVAYLPLGLIIRAFNAEEAEQKFGPCSKKIEEEFKALEPSRLLVDMAAAKAREMGYLFPRGAANAEAEPMARPKAPLSLEILELQFQECRGGDDFCLEIVVRARLEHPDTGRAPYDAIFSYSNHDLSKNSRHLRRSSNRKLVGPSSLCRTFDAFCEGDGQTAFKAEMLKGFGAIIAALFGSHSENTLSDVR